MSEPRNLLVELLVEELPPKALKTLGESFARVLADELKAKGLATADAAVTAFASPRRLAVHVAGVAAIAPDAEVVSKLMPVSVALGRDGRPTDALRKRLAKDGREALADRWPDAAHGADSLFVQHDGKAESLYLRRLAKGTALQVGLQNALDEALARLPIPKVMTYQLADGWTDVKFVRPAHALVALHGADVVGVTALGLTAGRRTHGHRFEAAVDPIELRDADSYVAQLQDEGAVIPGFEARRAEIARQLAQAAAAVGGACRPVDDPALLDEVTALVERPNVLVGQFEPAFLGVPPECLILTMKANQKYFPLLDAQGRLTHRFLLVSNVRPADPSAVVGGNERVVRPRLADARFFYDQDRKRTLASRVPGLDKVVYHARLGSQGDRVQRVRAIARHVAQALGDAALLEPVDLAAQLAKADLLTDMVGEFPELQGVMGGYYARHDGLDEAVAQAIEDHYRPRFAGDALPRGRVGLVVALADKLETLLGLFGIGQLPSGDKDPFALRRHALGVIRMLMEADLPLDLEALLQGAFAEMGRIVTSGPVPSAPAPGSARGAAMVDLDTQTPERVLAFMYDRLNGLLREQGATAQEVDAVLALQPQRLADVPRRLEAVRAFAGMPESTSLAAANKRVGNILRKAGEDVPVQVDAQRLVEPAERALYDALRAVGPVADAAFARGDLTASLSALAALKAPVDAFFDAVMVNADDAALRANRLGLLATLHAAMNRVADLSRLAA